MPRLTGIRFAAWRELTIFALVYGVVHRLSALLLVDGNPMAPLWPPAGLMVAALVLLPAMHPVVVLLALSVAGQLLSHGLVWPPAVTLAFIVIGWTEAWACAMLLQRWTDQSRLVSRVRDVPALVLATLAAVTPTALIAGVLSAATNGVFWQGFITWWVGGALGMLLFTPLAVAWRRRSPVGSAAQVSMLQMGVEITLLAAVLTAGAILAFRGTVLFDMVDVPPYALALPVMWTALRYGLRGVTASLLLIILVGLPLLLDPQSTALGGITPDARLLRMQVYIALMTVSGLTLSAALEERRAAAEQQARAAEALLQRERELRDSRHLEAVGKLAGGVAHDFNNILAALTLQVDELRGAGGTVQDNNDLVNEMQDTVARASRLTRQLLTFSQKQATTMKLVDLASLADDTCRSLRRMLPEAVTLEVSPTEALVWVEADGSMLEQVIMNLVLNARDAMPEGGRISVTLHIARLEVAQLRDRGVVAESAGRYAVVEVSDTGHGIPPGIRERIFDPFFTTKDIGKGTGLGLSTVYGIARQHGGFVRVAETSATGTRFEFGLPEADPPIARHAASA